MSFDSSNSRSKSKRSFNSLQSNPSNRSNSESNVSRKRKSSQKTLGMAWGSNSLSSSKASFRSSPFSDFGSYMVSKNSKLQDQFDAEASSSSHSCSTSEKPIFQGISIFVDGYTVPCSQELRGYMLKYGGRFENYFSRHRVTHIICSNLPDSKMKHLRSFSRGLPVVTPLWVVESIAANKLLSWSPYQLEQFTGETHCQPKLLTFFAPKKIQDSHDATACVNDGQDTETMDPIFEDSTAEIVNSPEKWEDIAHTTQDGVKSDVLEKEKLNGVILQNATYASENHSEVGIGEASDTDANGSCIGVQPLFIPCQKASSDYSHCLDNIRANKFSDSTIVGPSNQRHSTLMGPSFVESYFKNSRLHFIGTWRNRYQKRFPSCSNGLNRNNTEIYPSALGKTAIIHVDMDCFFVSVVIRNHPELQDKPVAVCHSDNPHGTAEISSANYPARDHGVRSGIFVRDAKALCPHLVIFPYNFEAYEKVADDFYSVLHKYCNRVQAVSCDEAFLDATFSEMEDPQLLASTIRKEIFDTTGCTASVGISGNMLMARLATKTAKPNGQFYILPEKVDEYLYELPIKSLPGIGRTLEEKLKGIQVKTCGQLRQFSKESLQKSFGPKTGDMLWNYSRGIDNRQVGIVQGGKSISAEVNWGVRFNQLEECQKFLVNLCKEVSLRLQGSGVKGRTFTLKIKKRRNGAEEPTKYLGCGNCENFCHSTTVLVATNNVDALQRISMQLFGSFHIDIKDIRGMGLQVSKLESVDGSKQAHPKISVHSWLITASEGQRRHSELHTMPRNGVDKESSIQMGATLPSLPDLDIGVIESLPHEVISEIDDMYGGKLMGLISRRKGKSGSTDDGVTTLPAKVEANIARELYCSNMPVLDDDKETQVAPVSEARTSGEVISATIPANIDLMPSSLSQVDTLVLQQLPEQLRADILEHLPAHRISVGSSVSNPSSLNHADILNGLSGAVSNDQLWAGNPPSWVDKFKVKKCWILKNLAEIYTRLRSTSCLSSILQLYLSGTQVSRNASTCSWDDDIHAMCELFNQYVEHKLETDIEEIYICLRYIRRLAVKSHFFSQVYNTILPHLQESVGERYGGNLCVP